MAVSQRDRDYLRQLGEYKRSSHAAAAAEHRRLPLAERLRRSWALFLRMRSSAREEARSDDPSRFYERARKRNLYRP